MQEMLDRRRRLIKYTLKKEREMNDSDPIAIHQQNDQFEAAYMDLVTKKNSVVTRFSSMQLEELLTSSTKNIAHEVVSCMIPHPGDRGLLLELEQEIQ